MTEKIYEKDSYCSNFTATVIKCEERKGRYFILLDRTAFFPEEGGQSADTGFIDEIAVKDVRISNGQIEHIVDVPIEQGKKVTCQIDWEKRYEKMQNHTGEHIVSGVIKSLFNYKNVGFHLGEDAVTLDVDGALDKEQIEVIEKQSNQIVYANKSIKSFYPTIEEQGSLDFRSKIEIKDGLRLVEIEDCDLCACCAPHVKSTGEVGIIKITEFSSHRGGTRLTLYCGEYARKHYEKTFALVSNVLKEFSANYNTLIDKVSSFKEENVKLKSNLQGLSDKFALATLETIQTEKVKLGFTSDFGFDQLRYCLNELTKESDLPVLIVSNTNGSNMYVLGSNLDGAQEIFNLMKSRLTVKGGFKNNFSQGKIENSKDEIIEFFNS